MISGLPEPRMCKSCESRMAIPRENPEQVCKYHNQKVSVCENVCVSLSVTTIISPKTIKGRDTKRQEKVSAFSMAI